MSLNTFNIGRQQSKKKAFEVKPVFFQLQLDVILNKTPNKNIDFINSGNGILEDGTIDTIDTSKIQEGNEPRIIHLNSVGFFSERGLVSPNPNKRNILVARKLALGSTNSFLRYSYNIPDADNVIKQNNVSFEEKIVKDMEILSISENADESGNFAVDWILTMNFLYVRATA